MRLGERLGASAASPTLGFGQKPATATSRLMHLAATPRIGRLGKHNYNIRRVVGFVPRGSASDASMPGAQAPFSSWPNPVSPPAGNGAPPPRGWHHAQYINTPGTASGAPGVASSRLGQWVVGTAGPWLPHLGPDAQVQALVVLGRIGSDSTNDWWPEFEETNSVYLQRMAPGQLASMVTAAAALRAPATADWLGRVLAALESYTSVAGASYDPAECAAAVAVAMHSLLAFPCIMPQADWLPRCLLALRPYIHELPHDSLASLAQLLARADPAALDAASATCGTALLKDLTDAMCDRASDLQWRLHTPALVQLVCGLAALGQPLPGPWIHRHLTSLSVNGLSALSPGRLIEVLQAVMSLNAASPAGGRWFSSWMQHVVAPVVYEMAWEMDSEQAVGALCTLHVLGCTAGGDVDWEAAPEAVLVRSLACKMGGVSTIHAAQMLRLLSGQLGAASYAHSNGAAAAPSATLCTAADLCTARMGAAASDMVVSDVCSILCTLGACSSAARGCLTLRPAILDSLLHHSVPLLTSCSQGELTDMLCALSDLGHRPSDKWQAAFMPALQLRMGMLEAEQLYRIAQAVTDLGITPSQGWVMDLFGASRRCLSDLDMGQVVALTYCLSTLSPGYIDWFWARSFEEGSIERLEQLGPVMLAVLVKALCDLHYRPSPAWQAAYLEAVRKRLFSPATACTFIATGSLPEGSCPGSSPSMGSHDATASLPGGSLAPNPASSSAYDSDVPADVAQHQVLPLLPVMLPRSAHDVLASPPRMSWALASHDAQLAGCTWSTVADALAQPTYAATQQMDTRSMLSGGAYPRGGFLRPERGGEVMVGEDAVTPDALVTVMEGLMFLRAHPGGTWMEDFTDAVRCQMSLLRPRHLSGVLSFCVATAYRPDAEWWADFLAAMQPQLRAMTAPDMANSLGAMHTLGVRLPHDFLAVWAAASEARLALLLPEQLSTVVTAMAASGYTPPARWLAVYEACTVQLAHLFEPLSLLRVVVILDRMGSRLGPDMLRVMYARTGPALHDVDPPVLSQLMWALQAAPSVPDEPWLVSFIAASQHHLPRFTTQQLEGLLAGLATLAANMRATQPYTDPAPGRVDALPTPRNGGLVLDGSQGTPAPALSAAHGQDSDGLTRVPGPRVVQLRRDEDGEEYAVPVLSLPERISNFILAAREWLC